jgi:hypothetical protein
MGGFDARVGLGGGEKSDFFEKIGLLGRSLLSNSAHHPLFPLFPYAPIPYSLLPPRPDRL